MNTSFSKVFILLSLGAASQAWAADCVVGINAAGTCTVPAGATTAVFEVWGGGGGGGSKDANSIGLPSNGVGGGGGSYCKVTSQVTPGSTLTVRVGTGGTAGVPSAGDWMRPGTSSTGGGLSAVTGVGVSGVTANGGGGGGGSTIWSDYDFGRGQPGRGATAVSGGAGGDGGNNGPYKSAPGGGGGAGATGGAGGRGGAGINGGQGSDGGPWDGVFIGPGIAGGDGGDGSDGGDGGPGGAGTVPGAGGAGGTAGFGGSGGTGGEGSPGEGWGPNGNPGMDGTPGTTGADGETLAGPLAVEACSGEGLGGADGAGANGGSAGGPSADAGSGGAGGQPGQPGLVKISFAGAQTLTFPPQPTAHQTDGGPFPVEFAATSNAGLPVSYTSLSPDICTVAGNIVTPLAAGTCTVAADQPGGVVGGVTYPAASQVVQRITITAAQTPSVSGVKAVPALGTWGIGLLMAWFGVIAYRRRSE